MIGLQYGTNKGASQVSIIIGSHAELNTCPSIFGQCIIFQAGMTPYGASRQIRPEGRFCHQKDLASNASTFYKWNSKVSTIDNNISWSPRIELVNWGRLKRHLRSTDVTAYVAFVDRHFIFRWKPASCSPDFYLFHILFLSKPTCEPFSSQCFSEAAAVE